MATERTDDIILDVLYGEHDAESGEAVEFSDEELAELEHLRAFRATLGSELPMVEPNPSVRASLMALAAAELSQSVDDIAGTTVRRPPLERESRRGFWSKLASGQGSQIALVATVLLVGAFVINFLKVDSSMAPAYEEAGYPSVASQPIALEESAPAAAPQDQPVVAEGIAEAEKSIDALKSLESPESLQQTGVGREARTRKADVIGEERAESPPVAESVQRSVAAKPKPVPSPAKKSIAKGISLADDVHSSTRSNTMPSTSARGAMPQPMEMNENIAGAKPALDSMMAAKSEEVAAAAGTLDAVEEAYRVRDYRRVITQADTVIESGTSAVQRARAMELKAQAYRQMGMLSQALTTYRNLEANFPSYQGDRVRASRLEVERQIESTSRPKERKRAAPSYDFSEDSVPSSAD